MQVNYPLAYNLKIGKVVIHSLQTVYELDCSNSYSNINMRNNRAFGYQELSDIFKKMAIVIPVKNEKLSILEGVLSGIPNECLIMLCCTIRKIFKLCHFVS